MNYITLNNGVKMPQVGYGVWQIPDAEVTEAVKHALDAGYLAIDTAKVYKNEKGVGRALAESDIAREDLFITTKVWNADHGYEEALAAYERSLDELGLDYVDLYLIHWPTPMYDKYIETYKALETLYKNGRVKAIGVSNFNIEHLERVLAECEIVPAVNQVECHPYFQQAELKAFCKKHDIHLTAYSPLQHGGELLTDSTLNIIAKNHHKTAAQVALRWHIQNDTIIIPKSVTPKRMAENLDIFDFELSDDEMEQINRIDLGERVNQDPNKMDMR